MPWVWIVDETRSLAEWRYAATVDEYLAGSVDAARIDCWAGAPPPLLICESRTFGGVLTRTLASEYLCPVTATNGQAGGFLHTNLAPLLRGNERRVLYVGDHDERGHMIEANTRRVLVRAAGRKLADGSWERIALTDDQVVAHGLEPIRKYDKVLRAYHDAVEVEALGQGEVTGIVRSALDGLLPEPLEAVQVREQEQRDAALAKLNGGGR